MKCIVPGTYQTLPPPNTILTIIMTTLVLPTASLTHTFLSVWPYWGFNREWEKDIYLSSHTTANFKSQYTFSSPKTLPSLGPPSIFLFVFSQQGPRYMTSSLPPGLPAAPQTCTPCSIQVLSRAVNYMASFPLVMLTMATEAKQVLFWLQGLPVGWSQIQLCQETNRTEHQVPWRMRVYSNLFITGATRQWWACPPLASPDAAPSLTSLACFKDSWWCHIRQLPTCQWRRWRLNGVWGLINRNCQQGKEAWGLSYKEEALLPKVGRSLAVEGGGETERNPSSEPDVPWHVLCLILHKAPRQKIKCAWWTGSGHACEFWNEALPVHITIKLK